MAGKHFVDSFDAGVITEKAKLTFIGAAKPAMAARSFSKWLHRTFNVDDFSSAVILRKAEECYRDPNKKPLAKLADEFLKPA